MRLTVSQFSVADVRRGAALAATQQGAHARLQLAQAERLDQIVVRAEIEPEHLFLGLLAPRQNQYRQRGVATAQSP